MNLTKKKKSKWTACYLCGKEFDEIEKIVTNVRGRCHYNGNYRGAANLGWNLRYKGNSYISVIAHNPSWYDNHLIIVNIAEKFKETF